MDVKKCHFFTETSFLKQKLKENIFSKFSLFCSHHYLFMEK